MAKEAIETLKKVLLVGFVLLNVALILVVWLQGFTDTGSADAGFSRQPGVPAYATRASLLTGTAAPTARPQSTPTSPVKTSSPTRPPAATAASSGSGTAQTPDATQAWLNDQKEQ
jgi:hypothetical protein